MLIRQITAPPPAHFCLHATVSIPPMKIAAPVAGSEVMLRAPPPVVVEPTGRAPKAQAPPTRFQTGIGRSVPPFVFPVIVVPASSMAHAAPLLNSGVRLAVPAL